ncbi:MAG: Ig-like domain-containing protein [Acidobacteriota bacterium]
MWRWVTRCLILAVLLCSAPALFAQLEFVGALDFPDPNAKQSGVIFFKGWALDPAQISDIQVYVDDQFIALANRGLPRIDVIEAYPQWPGIQNIAPGFQVGILASRFSNGTHTVEVRVVTSDNRVTPLGRRTIDIDNTINQAPFGNVDIPDVAFAYNASGSFPVQGWALDTDGVATVDVYVDGGILQAAVYGDARPDVANTYPDFPAALYSSFIANIDSTRIVDGIHLLEVKATDRQGLSRLIGRRQIQVFNDEANLKPFGYIDEPKRDAVLYGTLCATIPVVSPAANPQAHVTPVRGWALDLGTRTDTGRVAYVELMVDGVRWYSSDDCAFNTLFNTFTNCYGLTRYDVQKYYPNYPDVPRAGYLFTMDVGALLALGVRPGNHILKVRVGDQQQTFTELPGPQGLPVFFQCAEQRVFSAQGFIDVPAPFDYMKGSVVFQGWAASEVGQISSVEIIVDGTTVGLAQYGFPRPDVQEQYPFLRNTLNSGWRFTYDTTKLPNERHRLTVRVVDFFGQKTEIGSVDFYTQNANAVP